MSARDSKPLGGRPPKLYEFGGVSLSLTDWAEVSDLPRHAIIDRLHAGWSFSEAIVYKIGERPPGKEARYKRRAAAERVRT